MARVLTKAGRYQIVSELGRGSMGVVYQGFDPVIGRTVAIKTMLIEGLSSTEFSEYKARFQREAQAAGILAHPNIVTVYDFGEDEGVLFLAMEFLEGKSLQDLVEKQNILPVETIIPIFEQVCSALDHAHRNNIVHRDIKPANIMILNSGLVKVTDFGIAKIMSMGMTQAGQILGTPNYMSPEQVKGRSVDGRSDIFALGVILYELVTGEKPFGGQNITTVIYKIINENPIPPRELDSTIHPGLSFVISKALAKSPEGRFQTCRELAESLKNYRNLGSEPAPSETVVIKVPPIPMEPAAPPPTPTRQAAPARPAAPAPAPPRAKPKQPEVVSVAAEIGKVEVGRPAPAPREQRPSPQPAVRPPAFAAVKPQAKGTSPVVWALLAIVLIVAIAGGAYYFLIMKPAATQQASTATSAPQTSPASETPSTPAAQPSATQQPSTPSGQPAGTTQPATVAQPITPSEVAPKPESRSTETRNPVEPAETPSKPAGGLMYGKVFVNSEPGGAQISVDGRSDPDWVTPHTIDGLKAGDHQLTLSEQGYNTATKAISVVAGRTTPVNIALAKFGAPGAQVQPKPVSQPKIQETPTTPPPPVPGSSSNGVWRIVTQPPGAEVIIDGKSVGPSPAQATLPAGKHTYSIKLNNVEVYSGDVDLPASQITVTRVKLE